ncbi:hypothetical protein Ddye_009291 [Dipteronia dyeriana]|uniref:Uncharacterized protein n=1 Tax=Dipteronia dyeriana TaxID=168575 RepID=A0AAD9XB46_9ROSI|nr:hypothetical protein Ddye_009291 [Dipteronia dyeriana]
MHAEGSDLELAVGRQPRQRRVRFRMPAGHNSGEDVGGECEDRLERRIQDLEAFVTALRDGLLNSEAER